MFAQQLLEVFGKDSAFLHQVTEMSSELWGRKKNHERKLIKIHFYG